MKHSNIIKSIFKILSLCSVLTFTNHLLADLSNTTQNFNHFAGNAQCIQKTDEQYTNELVGTWRITAGPQQKLANWKKHGIEARFEFAKDNKVIESLVYKDQPGKIYLEASGYYYVLNGDIYFYYESVTGPGADSSYAYETYYFMLVCLSSEKFITDNFTFEKL